MKTFKYHSVSTPVTENITGFEKMKDLMKIGALAGLIAIGSYAPVIAESQDDCTLQNCQSVEGTVIRVRTRGESDPAVQATTEEEHQLNRRVEVLTESKVDRKTITEPHPDTDKARVKGKFVVYLKEGGVLWATEDPVALDPRLGFSGPTRVLYDERKGLISEGANFRYATNYSDFIEKLELLFFDENDTDLVNPHTTVELPVSAVNYYQWQGFLPADRQYRPGDTIQYALRAYGANGAIDETSAKRFQLLNAAEYESQNLLIVEDRDFSPEMNERNTNSDFARMDRELQFAGQLLGQSDLIQQNIAIQGSRIRILGQDLPEGYQLKVNGESYPVDVQRKFAAEYIKPLGTHQFDITLNSGEEVVAQHVLDANVTGKYFFMVGLADLTVSESSIEGSVEPLSVDDQYQDDLLTQGRLAFYLKGKIKGKYLVTAHADTQERELDELFDDFLAKDPQDIFRRLDPDQYYLVYGDDSYTYRDVDTQGRLYLRVDWDKSQALWGNFNTGIQASEFTQYNRSLYGAGLNWRSLNTNEYGEAKTHVRGFISEAQTAFGHDEFIGTGGSLYYLRNNDILPGSDKLTVEIRDRDSTRVVNTFDLSRDVDYEIDEFQGRVILQRPLEQITRDGLTSIIRDQAIDGNDVYLLVDYEYRPAGFDADHVTAGGRAKQWLGDHVAVGVTYVDENRAGDDYEMKGADITLQAGKGTYLRFEQSETSASQAPVFRSADGGFTFGSNNSQSNLGDFDQLGQLRSGDATAVDARANFKELGWTENNMTFGAWYRDTDAGYSIARRDLGEDIEEIGAEFLAQLNQRWSVYAKTNQFNRGDRELQQHSLQTAYRTLGGNQLIAELRQVNEDNAGTELSGSLAALEYRHRFSDKFEMYANAQMTLDNDDGLYDNNDRGTIGAKYLFAERSQVGAEYSNGHRGEAGSLFADYRLNDRHNLYGRYIFSTDNTFNDFSNLDNGLVLGHRSRISNSLTLYNENQALKGLDYEGFNHTFGLDYRLNRYWNMGLSLQHGEVDTALGYIDRDVATATFGYRNSLSNWQSKIEYRVDDGIEQLEQWVMTNRLTYRWSEDLRLAARFNYADTENDNDIDLATGLVDNADSKFVEAGLGFAWRPVYNDKWNVLGRYTYLYDLRPLSQRESSTDQRSNVFSLEAIRRINQRWEAVGKLAHRESELRLDRQDGEWFSNSADFAAIQLRYHLIGNWDALAEYRWLNVSDAESTRTGYLVALHRHIGDHFKVGIGYNFTDFSEDLTQLEYEYDGWFINVIGKY